MESAMLEEHQKILNNQQKRLLKLQLEMIQVWTVYLFDNQHRSFMNYICKQTQLAKPITLKTIEVFKNSKNIATQLRDGFLLQFIENKPQKTETIRINPHFFGLIPKLIQMIKVKINPEFQKMKNFNVNENKKICTVCKYETTQSQIKFMGARCDCPEPNFVDLKLQKEKKERYEHLERLFSYMISKLKEYQEIQNSIMKHQRQKDKKSEKKRSQYQIFLDKFGIKIEHDKKQTNYEYLQESFKAYSPKRQFEIAHKMAELRAQRNK